MQKLLVPMALILTGCTVSDPSLPVAYQATREVAQCPAEIAVRMPPEVTRCTITITASTAPLPTPPAGFVASAGGRGMGGLGPRTARVTDPGATPSSAPTGTVAPGVSGGGGDRSSVSSGGGATASVGDRGASVGGGGSTGGPRGNGVSSGSQGSSSGFGDVGQGWGDSPGVGGQSARESLGGREAGKNNGRDKGGTNNSGGKGKGSDKNATSSRNDKDNGHGKGATNNSGGGKGKDKG